MGPLKRTFTHSLCAFLLAGTAIAGPLSGPIDPTQPIDAPPTTKPALPGMPSNDPIMIETMLGFMIQTPIIAFNNTGVLNYTAGDGLLSVDADPCDGDLFQSGTDDDVKTGCVHAGKAAGHLVCLWNGAIRWAARCGTRCSISTATMWSISAI